LGAPAEGDAEDFPDESLCALGSAEFVCPYCRAARDKHPHAIAMQAIAIFVHHIEWLIAR